MAQPADRNTMLQCRLVVVFFKMRSAMHLLRDQMMERQRYIPVAAATGTAVARVCQFCAEGSAPSIAAVISSLPGFTPLPKWPSTSPLGETRYLLKFQRG